MNLSPGERRELNRELVPGTQDLDEVTVMEESDRSTTITRIDIKTLDMLPNASGNIESILATLPGVRTRNELSSQYSVRGGNYDENLVYVNDVEIHRPFLVRSSQQEGMSFPNPDMVSSIQFSAGGFESMYGDKMSSVLDIVYRRPFILHLANHPVKRLQFFIQRFFNCFFNNLFQLLLCYGYMGLWNFDIAVYWHREEIWIFFYSIILGVMYLNSDS